MPSLLPLHGLPFAATAHKTKTPYSIWICACPPICPCKTVHPMWTVVSISHVTEPPFPGASGGYIALSPFRNKAQMREQYPALTLLQHRSKHHYQQAYRLIGASALIDEHVNQTMAEYISKEKLEKRAAGIISREIPKKGGVGRLKKRFIDAVTPKGVLRLYSTADSLAERIYDFYDTYGFSYIMLEPICKAAVKAGYDVYACYCAKEPGKLKHVIVPELSLAFVTSDPHKFYAGTPFRRIRLDSSLLTSELRHLRGRAKILIKSSHQLMDEAVAEISSACALHDKMEALYRPYIDFKALDKMVAEAVKQIDGTAK